MKTRTKMKRYAKLIVTLTLLISPLCPALCQQHVEEFVDKGNAEYDKGHYLKAEDCFRSAIGIQERNGNVTSLSYLDNVKRLAEIWVGKCAFIQADSLYEKTLPLALSLFGEDSLEYIALLNDYAKSKIEQYKITEGVQYLECAISYCERVLGKNSLEYAESISNLVSAYILMQDLERADSLAHEAAEIRISVAGGMSKEYLNSLSCLGNVALYKREMAVARNYYEELIRLSEQLYGDQHPEHAKNLIYMTTLLGMEGSYLESIELLQKAIPVLGQNMGRNNIAYASAQSNLGGMYAMIGRYKESIPPLTEALHLFAKQVEKNSHYYNNVLNGLAYANLHLGRYDKAGNLYQEALDIRLQMYGPHHLSVIVALNNIADVYSRMGNWEKAKNTLLKAVDYGKGRNEELSMEYALCLYSLFSLYKSEDDNETACAYLDRALELMEAIRMESHPVYVIAKGEKMQISSMQNGVDNEKNEKEWSMFLDQIKQIFTEHSPRYRLALNNYAVVLMDRKEYERAIDIYLQCLEYCREEPENSEHFFYFYFNVAEAYRHIRNDAMVLKYYTSALDWMKQRIAQSFAFMSENERELYWYKYQNFYNHIRKLTYDNRSPDLPELLYNNELFYKSLLLSSSKEMQRSILKSGNAGLVALWQQIMAVKTQIARLESSQSESLNKEEQIVQMKNAIDKMEKYALSLFEPGEKVRSDFGIQWKDIQAALDKDEAAIEFITSANIDSGNNASEVYYYALLILPGANSPLPIRLCEEDEIAGKTDIHHYDRISRLIWQPVESYLSGVNRIYIAPVQELHTVAFDCLKDARGNYAFENYTIHHLLSTKDMLALKQEKDTAPADNLSALLFGGADYGLPYTGEGNEKEQQPDDSYKDILTEMEIDRGQGFDFLPNSRKEVKEVHEILLYKDWNSQLFVDREANETNFKRQVKEQNPSLIHISTHGFYFPLSEVADASSNPYLRSRNPLIRSGLLFTGANRTWCGGETDENTDDGILTAYEISNLNLSACKLAVLSACVTGLGEIRNGEGVYGLQRAFRLAGAKKMIVSLWEVPDKETSELMKTFYSMWNRRSNPVDTFRNVRQKMKETYPIHPEKWMGFVIIE